MSFLAFPPEVNSGLMYLGAGSASLMQAAAAWDGLSTDLSSAATSVSSVISGLDGTWKGPSASRMAAAAVPYTSWLGETAGWAQQMGAQATAQAGLYETAHNAVIPPPAIAANRLQLLTLVATNFFGQNTPAIAANEAQYAGYWATDGAVMDSYMAATQANVATLQQPVSPQPTTTGTTGADQVLAHSTAADKVQMFDQHAPSTAATNSGGGTGGESAGSSTGSSTGTGSGLAGLNSAEVSDLTQAAYLGSIPARFALYPISMLMQLARMGQMGGLGGLTGAGNSTALMESIGQFVDGKLSGAVGTLASHFTSATQAISAKLADAASLGSLRVPEAWSAAATGVTRVAPILPNAAVSAPSLSSSGFPGGPFGQALMGALSGRGIGGMAAKAPKVIPKPSAGG